MAAHGLMFHHFHNEGNYIKSQGSISAEELREMLKYYQEKGQDGTGCRILPAQEWQRKALENTLLPDEVCLTFDDGLKCQYEVAYPVLKELGLTAFFFIPTQRFVGEAEKLEVYRHFRFSCFADIDDFYQAFFAVLAESRLVSDWENKLRAPECRDYLREFTFYTENDRLFRYVRDKLLTEAQYHELMAAMMSRHKFDVAKAEKQLYLNKEEIRAMFADGNVIGLHSHTHYTSLVDTDYDRQKWEYTTNRQVLQDIIGRAVDTVSYPSNSYDEKTLQIMREMGVRLGFRANMEAGFGSVLDFPREDHTNIIRRMHHENHSIYQ